MFKHYKSWEIMWVKHGKTIINHPPIVFSMALFQPTFKKSDMPPTNDACSCSSRVARTSARATVAKAWRALQRRAREALVNVEFMAKFIANINNLYIYILYVYLTIGSYGIQLLSAAFFGDIT
jgi:hypothetical protein